MSFALCSYSSISRYHYPLMKSSLRHCTKQSIFVFKLRMLNLYKYEITYHLSRSELLWLQESTGGYCKIATTYFNCISTSISIKYFIKITVWKLSIKLFVPQTYLMPCKHSIRSIHLCMQMRSNQIFF